MKIQCSYTKNKSMLVCVGALDFHYIWPCWCLLNRKITDQSTDENLVVVQKFWPLDDYQNPRPRAKCPSTDQPRTGTRLKLFTLNRQLLKTANEIVAAHLTQHFLLHCKTYPRCTILAITLQGALLMKDPIQDVHLINLENGDIIAIIWTRNSFLLHHIFKIISPVSKEASERESTENNLELAVSIE